MARKGDRLDFDQQLGPTDIGDGIDRGDFAETRFAGGPGLRSSPLAA